jgi:elongation factor G
MDPVLEMAIEPKSRADLSALEAALQALLGSDGSLQVRTDQESGQTILAGDSERQLDLAVAALRRDCAFNIGAPQVAYRETLGQSALVEHTYKRPLGPNSDFAQVVLQFEPLEPGAGYQFESMIAPGSPLKEYIPGVERGLESAKQNGLLAGFPVVDFKATLVDGGWHDVDSSVRAFEIATRTAFRELRTKAAPILLEPIMRVEVLTPDDHMGDVIGDLNSRRGQVQGAETRGTDNLVIAMVPLSNMFGYPSQLQLITHGAGRCEMRYDHYEAVPRPFEPPDGTFPPAVGMRA